MAFESLFFWIFTAVLLVASVMVVTSRNPVHAALWLILAFTQASGLWLLLRAEFLAIVLVLVYIGAVMVLFLFVVMMLDIAPPLRRSLWKSLPWLLLVGLVIVLELSAAFHVSFRDAPVMQMPVGRGNTYELGSLLFRHYLLPFVAAGVLLLVAMIAAISITHRASKARRGPAPHEQVRARRDESVELVRMPAATDATQATEATQPSSTDTQGAATSASPTASGSSAGSTATAPRSAT